MNTNPEKPNVLVPNFDAIPAYVRRFPHWVVWRNEWAEERGAWTKVPYDAKTLRRAASDNLETWTDFDDARETYLEPSNELSGIGFVFNPANDLFGVDFDRCLDASGLTKPFEGWIEKFNSYTEVSVSGTGLHIIARGVVGSGHRSAGKDLEIYDRLRYFCFSGHEWGTPRKLGWRQLVVESFVKEFFPQSTTPRESRPTPLDVGKNADELLRLAFAAKNGDSIFRLFQGDVSEYGGDDSSADLALCSKLAFWSGGSPTLLDEMFRGSRLYREKWNKRHSADGRTYGQMTVDKALIGCSEFYSGRGRQTVSENGEVKSPPGVYTVRSLKEKVLALYKTGGHQQGEHPGWDNLAKLYTVRQGQFTILTGIPGSGKSAFLDAMLVNLACSRKWRFAITSMENQPLEQHVSQLTEIYVGEPFSQGPTPRMSIDVLNEALDAMHKHFTFVLPSEELRTLPGLLELVSDLDVEGVVVDPWNELEHRRPAAMTETEYVSQALSKMRHHARLFNQHWWLVAHPTKLPKDKDGNYLVPTLYDCAGSAAFRNKADMGLVCWRDFQDEFAPTTVHVQKVRFRWCGKLGSCDLYFDKKTGRYSEKPKIYSVPTYREEFA